MKTLNKLKACLPKRSVGMAIVVAMFALLTMTSAKINAQVTLEHQYYIYHKDFYPINLGNNDYKYVITDSLGFSLYNLDHSPYLLNVVTPFPLLQPSGFHYEIAYISKSLFDCDSTNIEYVLTIGNVASNFYVYRTDGTLLFERDSVTGSYNIGGYDGSLILQPIVNTPNGTKLFLQDNKGGDYDSVYVYSLCGTLATSKKETKLEKSFVQVFPNPASGIINFEINQQNHQEKFKLTIYNTSFQKVDEAIINSKNYQLDIKQKSLSSGTYLFDLRTDRKVFQTGKFIISQ